MATVDVTIQASKELYELGQGIKGFLAALKEESKDGLDVTDIGAVLAAAMTSLVPALDGVTDIADEIKDDPQAAIYAAVTLAEGIFEVVKS